MENSRNTQFVSYKLHDILSGVMKSHTTLFYLTWDPQPLTSSTSVQPLPPSWLDDPRSPKANDPPCRHFIISHHHKKGEYKQ